MTKFTLTAGREFDVRPLLCLVQERQPPLPRTAHTDLGLFVTLDGYASGDGAPAYFGYDGPKLDRWIERQLHTPQVLLLGRRTYEMFAKMSTAQRDGTTQRLRDVPKLVFSNTTALELPWQPAERVGGEVTHAIRALKQAAGPPLRTMGSLTLVRALLRDDLVDRLRLAVFPVALGETGREPFFRELPDLSLRARIDHARRSRATARVRATPWGPAGAMTGALTLTTTEARQPKACLASR